MAILDVRDLRYYYRTRRGPVKAVDSVSFSIDAGKTLAVVGESGCGKTSTATAILRLLPRNVDTYEGQVLLDDHDIMAYSDEEFRKEVRWRRISIVFQGAMNALSPTIRCGIQLAEPLMVHQDVDKEEALAVAREGLRSVGLPEDVALRYPHELSGGMKQRVVIAMALVMKPKLVILDEPTSALDVMTQANIINLLKRLQREASLSYLFITHDLGLASELADDVAIMYAGRFIEVGPASRVYPSPRHPYTQRLIQSVPLLRSEVAPDFIPGAPPDLTKVPEGCPFHPRCPAAFNLCGWSVVDLQGFLEQRSLSTPGATHAGSTYEAKGAWKLVITPRKGMGPSAVVHELQALVAQDAATTPILTAVESIVERSGRAIVTLRTAERPGFTSDDSRRAACWLLTEAGESHAAA